MEYRVYIVRNSEGRIYIGLSEDVVNRVADHNEGVSKCTSWVRGRAFFIATVSGPNVMALSRVLQLLTTLSIC
jgi:predicted GIY-YIG superfamily endonuclease